MSFDLQEALNGAPVKLRNGQKAYVVGISKLGTEDGNSYIVGEYGRNLCNWSKDGKYWLRRESGLDIVGMYEESELTPEQVLEKAYQEGLRVRLDDGFEYPVIGKARGGSYLLGDERSTYIMWCQDLGEPEICQEDTVELSQKSDTITVTLPKPFSPKVGNAFYFISDSGEVLVAHFDPGYISHVMAKDTGRCFRTESDAKAWLDAMKKALGD